MGLLNIEDNFRDSFSNFRDSFSNFRKILQNQIL